MKKLVRLLSLGAIAMLAGCASAPGRVAADDQIDYEKVALINKWATHNGVLVQWVNYPVKSSSQTGTR